MQHAHRQEAGCRAVVVTTPKQCMQCGQPCSGAATYSVVDYDCVSFISGIGTVGGLSLRGGEGEGGNV